MPGGVVKKSAGSGMLGVLMGDASATDELAAAAVGMKLLKKGKKESQHRHEQMNDTGASRYRKPKVVQTGPLLKMGGVTGIANVKTKLVKEKEVAIEKLEAGRTLDYTADSLERMNPEALKRYCIKYRLNTKGKPDEMRGRLAELLLSEKKRTNAWLHSKAMGIASDINERADEAINEYDVVADDGMSFVRYAVDFANWTQTNCCTLCTRKIRRLVVKLGVV